MQIFMKPTANDGSGQQNPSAENTTLALNFLNFSRMSGLPAVRTTS